MKSKTNQGKLVAENRRYVGAVAQQYLNQGLTLEQLIEEGNKGLVAAAERYDEGKGRGFMSYAVWRVRESILKALVAVQRGIPMPGDNPLTARERGILRSIADGESLAQIAADRRLTEERLRQIIMRINDKILNNE